MMKPTLHCASLHSHAASPGTASSSVPCKEDAMTTALSCSDSRSRMKRARI